MYITTLYTLDYYEDKYLLIFWRTLSTKQKYTINICIPKLL